MRFFATNMRQIRRNFALMRKMSNTVSKMIIRAIIAFLIILSIFQPHLSPITAQSRTNDGGYQQSVNANCLLDYGKYRNPDDLDGLSYWVCECVSFTAWKLKQAGVSSSDFTGLDHAKHWVDKATRRGSAMSGDKPRAGAIAVNPKIGKHGHVVWVVDSLDDGRRFRYQDYNGNNDGQYGTGEKESSGWTFLYFSNVTSGDGSHPDKPRTPQGLEIKNIKRTEAKFDWKGRDGVHYWCVNWSSDNQTPSGCDVRIRGRDSSMTARDLRPNRQIWVWVQACSRNDICSYAAKTSFKTKK